MLVAVVSCSLRSCTLVLQPLGTPLGAIRPTTSHFGLGKVRMALQDAGEQTASIATAAATAPAINAEKYAVLAGNSGDVQDGAEGIQPVVAAAVEASESDEGVKQAVEQAAAAAMARTNANAASVAGAIIVAARSRRTAGARSPAVRCTAHCKRLRKRRGSPRREPDVHAG